ncbi:phosphonate C-P lyase system protein PhnG [Celeribacter arenosi]|uniref:Phosphonate C-P lyase system protein PhnG n=1 Tax=Celeribacter arenosi TaxID=792649 RepID=A0ABP7K875_9RHOB
MSDLSPNKQARQGWMSLLAKAPPRRVVDLFDAFGSPEFEWLRVPEIGSVMVRGRMGGTGSAFNLGEMSVTRCSVKLVSGEVGHAYVQGRDKAHAQSAALIDALMQTDRAPELRAKVLDPLSTEMAAAKRDRAQKAAATKVDFFTLVRGED